MVYINDQKFACESCIKGHRSSSCTHNDRPLFEVKGRGRPVSQCEKCRERRKNKSFHTRCICETERQPNPVKPLHASAALEPTLPNGLKDALSRSSAPLPPSDPRARGEAPTYTFLYHHQRSNYSVDTLLNPCHCKDIWSCNCAAAASGLRSEGSNGLDTLAFAAASLPPDPTSRTTANLAENCRDETTSPAELEHSEGGTQNSSTCCTNRPALSSPMGLHGDSARGPVLPPILAKSFVVEAAPPLPPTFSSMPPISTIINLAGSGCTCGFDCKCPGCVEHRSPDLASKEHSGCPDCGTCVDQLLSAELPSSTSSGSASTAPSATRNSHTHNFFEAFMAKAASIPPPPAERVNARDLDPMNITTYPTSLFSGPGALDERSRAFGLVRVPKLDCCAGRCGCPSGSCGCGDECDGCCSH